MSAMAAAPLKTQRAGTQRERQEPAAMATAPTDPMMEKWHRFFLRAMFPLTFSDRDKASLHSYVSLSPDDTHTFLAPGEQVFFSFEAVDVDDYAKGYKVRTGETYVGGISTFFGQQTESLTTTTDPRQALVFHPVFHGPMIFSLLPVGSGLVMTRLWDDFGDGPKGRACIDLFPLAVAGSWDAKWEQQVFQMPGWPIRVFSMAYLPPDLHFTLKAGGKTLYADGSRLAWGEVSDSSALCSAVARTPTSLHAGYALNVGGKFVKMTAVDQAVSLVETMADATPLCAIINDDGSLSFWHCESDHVLATRDNLPVFTLNEDPQAAPPSWTAGDPGLHVFQPRSVTDTVKTLADTVYIKVAVAKLNQDCFIRRRVTWDYSFDNVMAADWLISTPENAFGNYGDFEMSIGQRGANDFNLRPCDGTAPNPKLPCVELASSVNMPGGTPLKLHAGHSRVLYEEMYKLIISGNGFIDILSLLQANGTPTGEFLAALRNAITYLSHKPEAANVTVRLLFGEPLGWAGRQAILRGTGPYQSAPDLLRQLVRDIPAGTTSRMKIFVAYTASVYAVTWNHAKVIAVDAQRALVGGHNMWSEPYLGPCPVLDVSMKLSGLAAADAHRFADNLWFQQVISHGDYWLQDVASFSAPATFATGQAAVPAPRLFQLFYQESAQQPGRGTGSGVAVLSAGREEGSPAGQEPGDKALVSLVKAATQSIYISAQAVSSTLAVFRYWPGEFLDALAAALVRGVRVTIFLSGPGEGSYAYAGDPPVDVLSQIQNRLTGRTSSEVAGLMARLSVRSFPPGARWGYDGQPGISNHAKVMMIDKIAFSIGSQNYYPSDPATLSEFTYVIEDAGLGDHLYRSYFEKLEAWTLPSPGIPPPVDRHSYVVTLTSLNCDTVADGGTLGMADTDQCFLKVFGVKVWPSGRYIPVSRGVRQPLGELILPPVAMLDNVMVVSLWEWDWFRDDCLFRFTFHPDVPIRCSSGAGQQTRKLSELTPGTVYEAYGEMIDGASLYTLTFKFDMVWDV